MSSISKNLPISIKEIHALWLRTKYFHDLSVFRHVNHFVKVVYSSGFCRVKMILKTDVSTSFTGLPRGSILI